MPLGWCRRLRQLLGSMRRALPSVTNPRTHNHRARTLRVGNGRTHPCTREKSCVPFRLTRYPHYVRHKGKGRSHSANCLVGPFDAQRGRHAHAGALQKLTHHRAATVVTYGSGPFERLTAGHVIRSSSE